MQAGGLRPGVNGRCPARLGATSTGAGWGHPSTRVRQAGTPGRMRQPPGSASPSVALPPPQAGSQPPTPGAKQRHNFAAVLNAARVSNQFTAAAAAAGLPAPAPVGVALRRAGLHCASIIQRRYGRRSCRAEGVRWGRGCAASMARCTATATTATTVTTVTTSTSA